MTLVVWVVPHLSQECQVGPVLRQPAYDRAVLAYDYESDAGEYEWTEVRFSGMIAVRFTQVGACTAEPVAALDRLVEVTDSNWADQLREPPPAARHFCIFFEDIGSYDFLALNVTLPMSGETGGEL